MTIEERMRVKKFEMIFMGKLQKISALSFGDTDKNEYLTGNEILPPHQFTYSLLPQAFEKQVKTLNSKEKNKQKRLKSKGKSKLKF